MSNENAELIRRAYQAYAKGDLDPMLELVDPATVGRAPLPGTASVHPSRGSFLS
jgi:ketosteroid isomerase-like protein